ncbi:MAG: glycosyltransferase family 4 protein [Candidatus Aminicenantia bacterium]
MKIAFIGQKGIPATFGGVEYHVDELSKGLVTLGYEVNVYVRNWYTEKNLHSYKGVRLIHIPTIKTKHLDASIHSLLCSIHSIFQKSDIIHYHAIGPSFFSLIPRLFGKKIVSTVHRLDWDTEKWGKIAKTFLKIGEYISTKIPPRTIVVSEELKDYFKDKYGKETIHIPHGTDLFQPRPAGLIKQRYNLEGKDYILFMGRLVPEKRVDWLIKSFQSLNKHSSKLKNIKLVIAGGSSATDDYVQRLKELSKNDPEIIYTGFVTGIEKEELLSNALIFVLPSYLEGFPIVLLEAKSYGLCCLASDIPPHCEAIHSGIDGLLFHSDNFSDLILKLQTLIDDPEKVEIMGRNARKEMKKRPSWEEVVKKTEEVYQKLLRR